jgi:hypothetical protein
MTGLRHRAKGLFTQAHKNVAVAALVNKLARVAWTVLWWRETFAIHSSPVAE